MPEKSYSHRALIDKLGVKQGARVVCFGIDDEVFRTQLRDRTADWSDGKSKRDCDVVMLGVQSPADLRKIPKCARSLKPGGGLWIVYPKGRKDITEAQVREAGLASGLVDNKVVGFSATHTGLRFVIRLADR